jgi:hypothetical protein
MTERRCEPEPPVKLEIGSVDPHALKIPVRRAATLPFEPDFYLIFTLNQDTRNAETYEGR